jgi:hypothetical protein
MRLFLHHYGEPQTDESPVENNQDSAAPLQPNMPSAAEIVAVICEEEALGQ